MISQKTKDSFFVSHSIIQKKSSSKFYTQFYIEKKLLLRIYTFLSAKFLGLLVVKKWQMWDMCSPH